MHEAIHLRGRQTEEVLVIPNKYKLAREGINKEKGRYFYFLGWSQLVLKEMSFQLLFEGWQGSSIPDRVGRSFHQPGVVNENVLESDFEPLLHA